jgi:hypothetical protein
VHRARTAGLLARPTDSSQWPARKNNHSHTHRLASAALLVLALFSRPPQPRAGRQCLTHTAVMMHFSRKLHIRVLYIMPLLIAITSLLVFAWWGKFQICSWGLSYLFILFVFPPYVLICALIWFPRSVLWRKRVFLPRILKMCATSCRVEANFSWFQPFILTVLLLLMLKFC